MIPTTSDTPSKLEEFSSLIKDVRDEQGNSVTDRFEYVRFLGAGSFGKVFEVRDRERGGTLFAIKIIPPGLAKIEAALRRFELSFLVPSKIDHPNIVKHLEYLASGRTKAILMEVADKGDLSNYLTDNSPTLSIPQVINLLKQLCLGAEAIHNLGYVHRNIKVENVLVFSPDIVKITDFHIVHDPVNPISPKMDVGIVGTLDFPPPEYLHTGMITPTTDIYSLSIIGFELLTKQSPFKGGSVMETMKKAVVGIGTTPSELRSDCPKELDNIILKGGHIDPLSRYQTASELFSDLNAIC
jgi:serine/threonine protein kinase